MTRRLRRLCEDCSGTSAMEFALVAPAFIVMMLGVMQVGLWMHGYNGLRAVASETSRYITVEYQKGNRVSNYDAAVWARNTALDSSYILDGGTVSTVVVDDANQNIAGITRKTLTVNYQMSSFLGMIGIDALDLSFSRPMFVKSS